MRRADSAKSRVARSRFRPTSAQPRSAACDYPKPPEVKPTTRRRNSVSRGELRVRGRGSRRSNTLSTVRKSQAACLVASCWRRNEISRAGRAPAKNPMTRCSYRQQIGFDYTDWCRIRPIRRARAGVQRSDHCRVSRLSSGRKRSSRLPRRTTDPGWTRAVRWDGPRGSRSGGTVSERGSAHGGGERADRPSRAPDLRPSDLRSTRRASRTKAYRSRPC